MKKLTFRCVLSVCFLGSIISCTRPDGESSKVTIQLPAAGAKSSIAQSITAQTESGESNWSGSITSHEDINCYMVAIGGFGGNKMTKNSCKEKDTGAELFTFGPYVGGVKAGDTIELSVPSGSEQNIILLGMKASDISSCKSFKGDGPGHGLLTYPRVLATQKINLQPGTVDVPIEFPRDLSNLSEVDECIVSDDDSGSDSGESSSEKLFGKGRDGTLNFATTPTVNVSLSSNTALNDVDLGSYTGSMGTKYFSSYRRITEVGLLTGKILTLDSTFTANDFAAGDKVLWHVGTAWSATGGPDNACGGDLFRGRWGLSKITAVSYLLKKVTISEAISDSPSTINNTNLGKSSASGVNGTEHCFIQLVRVPQFESISVSTTRTLNIAAPQYSAGVGGIIAIQTKHLIVDGALNVNSAALGLPSIINGSTGASGKSIGGMNENGGQRVSSLGSGGGQAGAGGNSSTASGGSAVQYCLDSSVCLPFKDRKAFMGGSGSGSGSTVGGNGGGIVFLFAKHVSGTGSVYIKSSGLGASGGAGAGAAGSILYVNRTNTANNTYLQSFGGTATSGGGGGGGGSVEEVRCTGLVNNTSAINLSGGSGYAPAGNGVSLLTDLALTDPDVCQ